MVYLEELSMSLPHYSEKTPSGIGYPNRDGPEPTQISSSIYYVIMPMTKLGVVPQ